MNGIPPEALQRSMEIYLGDPARAGALDSWYAQFVSPGTLVFDIGAHVGDRTSCFRRLGARVVAAEPQQELAALLSQQHEGDPLVEILPVAVGAEWGEITLHVNAENPTVSTASRAFITAACGQVGWRGQSWTEERKVPVVTMDDLIRAHGVPAFAKIDVEGFEGDVIAGLSQSVPALSFEFTTIQRDVARSCLHRLSKLGFSGFRGSLGESLRFAQEAPVSAGDILDWLESLPVEANSGDIYAWSGLA